MVEHDGLAGGREGSNALEDRPARLDVHADGRLVEKERLRITAHGEREVEPLALASGQRPNSRVGLRVEPGQPDGARRRQR